MTIPGLNEVKAVVNMMDLTILTVIVYFTGLSTPVAWSLTISSETDRVPLTCIPLLINDVWPLSVKKERAKDIIDQSWQHTNSALFASSLCLNFIGSHFGQ